MLKDLNSVLGALKEDFNDDVEAIKVDAIEMEVKQTKEPVYLEPLSIETGAIKNSKDKSVKVKDEPVVVKCQSGISLFISFIMQLTASGIILVLLSIFTSNSLVLNTDLIKSTYKSTMRLDGNILVLCSSIDSFIADVVNSLANYDYTVVYVKIGVAFITTVFGLYISYSAFKLGNSVSLTLQRVILVGGIVASVCIQGYALKDNFAFMPNVIIYQYLDNLSEDELQDLAMRVNGVKIQVRYDGTTHGIYKANKEAMLDTLISSSSNWGVDFELPKELRILGAEFKLKDVTNSEFIYVLPEVEYVKEVISEAY